MRRKTYENPNFVAAQLVMAFASAWDYGTKNEPKNQTKILSTRQVEEPLFHAAQLLGMDEFELHFKVLRDGEHDAYIKDQKILRGWLEKIAMFKNMKAPAQTALLSEIKRWADKVTASTHVEIERGRFKRIYRPHFSGVQAVIGEVLTRLPALQPGAFDLVQGDILKCPMCKRFVVMSRSDMSVCSAKCRAKANRPK